MSDNQMSWDNISRKREMQPESGIAGFAARYGARLSELKLTDAEISRQTGIPSSSLSRYRKGEGVPKAEHLFPLSDVLKADARWLVSGVTAPASVIDAEDAEWEQLPFFDLRDLSDTGKGRPHYWTPFRKDWLNRALGTSVDLYLVRLLSDYHSRTGDRDLTEGDLVFCREITPVELQDGHVVIWRREQGLKVARYSLRPRERVEEDVITPEEVGDDQFVPVARILGKYLQRV
ncbi:helix-turn-helix domain-containing protein [Sphingobium ummariense]|uniref:helix-turn-helix domain-containing protein n=1 Tax=Sphingobium ummariense TaxID=420994 RepID=UPI001378FFE7|nr:helix-turn-helix domain-containing protein [Sphingobium ummariense]